MARSTRGTPHTEESKRKLREANLGRKLTDEDKLKMSKAAKARKGSKYIHNPISHERRRVKEPELSRLLGLGWILGK